MKYYLGEIVNTLDGIEIDQVIRFKTSGDARQHLNVIAGDRWGDPDEIETAHCKSEPLYIFELRGNKTIATHACRILEISEETYNALKLIIVELP